MSAELERDGAQDVKAVLFDWDGTLIDSGAILITCWHRMSEQVLGYRFPVEEADRRKFLAMRGADSFPLLSDDPSVLAAMDQSFTDAYLELAAVHVRAFDHATELLEALRARGIRTGVVTSKTQLRFNRDAEITGLDDLLDVVVTGDDVTQAKPHPEGVLAALATLGVEPEHAWFVGDGPVDVWAGLAAGVTAVAITHGLHSADELHPASPLHMVASLEELAALVAAQTSD